MTDAATQHPRLETALRAAERAGEELRRRLAERDFSVDHKADGSPVTTADLASEAVILETIRADWPGDAVLSEEAGEHAATDADGARWIIDPIDGTISFAHGVPLFGVLIGIEVATPDGPVIDAGVIAMPCLHEYVYAARGLGAWRRWNDDVLPARVSDTPRLDDAMVSWTDSRLFDRKGVSFMEAEMRRRIAMMRGWPDCYAHVLVATGRADATIEPSVSVWDVAPLPVIMDEAGGRFSDWRGAPDIRAGDAIISNGRLHDALLACAAQHPAK